MIYGTIAPRIHLDTNHYQRCQISCTPTTQQVPDAPVKRKATSSPKQSESKKGKMADQALNQPRHDRDEVLAMVTASAQPVSTRMRLLASWCLDNRSWRTLAVNVLSEMADDTLDCLFMQLDKSMSSFANISSVHELSNTLVRRSVVINKSFTYLTRSTRGKLSPLDTLLCALVCRCVQAESLM